MCKVRRVNRKRVFVVRGELGTGFGKREIVWKTERFVWTGKLVPDLQYFTCGFMCRSPIGKYRIENKQWYVNEKDMK